MEQEDSLLGVDKSAHWHLRKTNNRRQIAERESNQGRKQRTLWRGWSEWRWRTHWDNSWCFLSSSSWSVYDFGSGMEASVGWSGACGCLPRGWSELHSARFVRIMLPAHSDWLRDCGAPTHREQHAGSTKIKFRTRTWFHLKYQPSAASRGQNIFPSWVFISLLNQHKQKISMLKFQLGPKIRANQDPESHHCSRPWMVPIMMNGKKKKKDFPHLTVGRKAQNKNLPAHLLKLQYISPKNAQQIREDPRLISISTNRMHGHGCPAIDNLSEHRTALKYRLHLVLKRSKMMSNLQIK